MANLTNVRNLRYPDLRPSQEGVQCFTCASYLTDGECPRQCNDLGPVLSVDLMPMDNVLRVMSQELGTHQWFVERSEVIQAIGAYRHQLTGPALAHMESTLKAVGLE